MKKRLLPLFAALLAAGNVHAQFGATNLAVLEAASSTANNTTGSIVELTKSGAAQTPVASYPIPGTTGTNALRFSGSASSTMYLSNSNDRSLICFTGANTTTATGNINTFTARGVGTFNPAGTYNLAATYTGISGNQTRSATTINNTDYFIADQGGVYTNNATAPSPTGNLRGIKAFGGVTYVATASSTTTIIQVNTVSAPSNGVLTGLPGLTNDAAIQDFYLVRSGTNGTTYDVLYTIAASSNTAGTISKFSLVSGTWTANGTYTTTFGGYGMAAEQSGTGANLYVSSGQGALTANNVVKLADAAGFNASINITTANNIILYTAGAGATVKGVAFAPAIIAVPALTVTPSATIANTFTASVSTASTSDSFTVSGTNLTSNVTVTAPPSFQVSTTLNGSYSASVSLTPTAGTLAAAKVYVRFFPTATGTATGNVVVSATGAASQNVPVSGATPGPVVLASVSSITNTFTSLVNNPSAADSFTVSGNNLTGNVIVTAAPPFQVASTLAGPYSSTVTFTPVNGTLASTKVYVRFLPTVPGTVTGNVTVTSNNATTQTVAATGTTPTPVITNSANNISASFTAPVGGTSASDTFSVTAIALNSVLTVTAPVNFEVSTVQAGPYSNSLTLTPVNGTVPSTLIYVRFHPLTAGIFTDTVKVTAAGAVTRNLVVSGFTGTATNPVAFPVASGAYLFSQWDSTSAAGTYPPNMIFHATNMSTSLLTAEPLVSNWVCPYNLTNRPRFKGLNADGVSMINTGNPQYDNCASGGTVMNTFVGAALLAVNTNSATNVTLKYNAGLVKQGDGSIARVYNLRLQYRMDSVSNFTDMAPLSDYTSAGKSDGDVQTFSMVLPGQFENKPYVEFRWLYYADTTITGAGGTRPEIRLDEVSVMITPNSVGNTPGGKNGIRIYPNPLKSGSDLHFSAPLSGRLYDAFGRTVATFSNAKTLATSEFATGIYTIVDTDGGRYRIVIQ